MEWFVRRMTEIRDGDPAVGFFLSCDVPEVQQEVVARVPETVGLAEKGSYNSRQAVQSAVIDLYLLAASSHLLAPHYSSFPELAHFLAGERFDLETSVTDPRHAWERRDQQSSAAARDPLHPSVV